MIAPRPSVGRFGIKRREGVFCVLFAVPFGPHERRHRNTGLRQVHQRIHLLVKYPNDLDMVLGLAVENDMLAKRPRMATDKQFIPRSAARAIGMERNFVQGGFNQRIVALKLEWAPMPERKLQDLLNVLGGLYRKLVGQIGQSFFCVPRTFWRMSSKLSWLNSPRSKPESPIESSRFSSSVFHSFKRSWSFNSRKASRITSLALLYIPVATFA